MKLIFAVILSLSSTVAYAITPDQIEFCKRSAQEQLQFEDQMAFLNGNYHGSSNPTQIMQQAFDQCIKSLQESEARQNQINSWQPNQLRQAPSQQPPQKKRWFNW